MRRRKLIFLASAGAVGTIACGNRDRRSIATPSPSEPTPTPVELLAGNSTLIAPDRYLKQLNPPKFARKHTLPPLTRFGWVLPFETRVELAERWGYALEWGGYAGANIAQLLADPNSTESKIVALAASQPNKYKLCVILDRSLPTAPDSIWLRDAGGNLIDGKQTWSPEAPTAALAAAAKLRADPLATIARKAPISIVLNGGEYGLGVVGAIQKAAERDPRVVRAKGNRDWFDYLSERKAYQESFITKAVRQVVPNRLAYINYGIGSNSHRERYGGWKDWGFDYKYLRTNADYPSSSTYFQEFNSGWTGNMDILTQVLNAVGEQIKFGQPLSYNWVCSGWRRGENPVFGEIDRYIGFLKCYYTAGMIGGIAGYFDLPKGGFEAKFAADNPPNWLLQIVALARVHAQFSHLESYLRSGDLLPGPMKHIWSKDTPAYEFPTADPEVRVLARKHRHRSSWLITAWAAGGNARQVSVEIPQLGRVTLMARPNGSVHTAQKTGDRAQLTWLDA